MIYGYVRVSTRDQNEARQLAAMREFGVEKEKIIVEKLPGKDFRRPHYQRLVKGLGTTEILSPLGRKVSFASDRRQ